jgi:hypothetical protein
MNMVAPAPVSITTLVKVGIGHFVEYDIGGNLSPLKSRSSGPEELNLSWSKNIHLRQFPDQRQPRDQQINPARTASAPGKHDPSTLTLSTLHPPVTNTVIVRPYSQSRLTHHRPFSAVLPRPPK